jgi:glutamate/tyrosine decarboxylase-like PLP-dependent enzyme
MGHLDLPLDSFFDIKNQEEIERLTQKVLGIIFEQLQRPPFPAGIIPSLDPSLPETPQSEAVLLSQLQTVIAGSINPAHPGYIGHMDPLPTTVSVLSDLVIGALNNNMFSVELSPMLSRLEFQVLQQIAAYFGLGDQAGGVLVSGGSLANLQAIAVARNLKLGSMHQGLTHLNKKPVILASEVAHTSLVKAAMVLGLGTEAVIPVAVNANSQMDPGDLIAHIEQAKSSQQIPFCVVATAGTTTTGNIDPLPAIAKIAHEYDLWFHVDAAYGGSILFSPEHRHRLTGIEQADSITFNPQKWLYVTKVCAMILFREIDLLNHSFRIQAPYMQSFPDVPNLGDMTLQGTRHPDILKFWLSLQQIGLSGYAELINQSYHLTEYFLKAVKIRPYLELASEPDMNLICFRSTPTWIPADNWDAWNTYLQIQLLKSGSIFLSLPLYRQHRWLRAVLLNPFTDKTIIDQLFHLLDQEHEKQDQNDQN